MPSHETKTTITKRISKGFTAADIIAALNHHFGGTYALNPDDVIPKTADISVRVPGGGDWSNTYLDIDRETGPGKTLLRVRWTETKEA
jgi:hypothetical protein